METISYSECLKEMFALGRFGIKLELETIANILQKLGSPEKTFCSVHIAGTNGKGSIASYIASILQFSGFSVGLYTSPHLIKFNERFCINGKMASDEDIIDSYLAVKQADTGYRKATFFEISTAIAFYLFAKSKVDWAVIETGMGGRLDATNVLQPAITVISNLSLEHTEYLGDTLEQIAAEKAGIIKHNTPLVTGITQESAISVITKIANQKSAPIFLYGKEFSATLDSKNFESDNGKFDDSFFTLNKQSKNNNLINSKFINNTFTYNGINETWDKMKTSLIGEHQIKNSAIALAVCEILMMERTQSNEQQQTNRLTEETIRKGLTATNWPGRLEYIMQKPSVVIDGAHNLDAAENLGKYLQKSYETENLTMVIGILNDKPYKEMLTYLLPVANRVIFTKAKIDRSLDPKTLKDFAINYISNDIEAIVIQDVGEAVEYAITTSSEKDCICIAGSLYVAGEAREKILKDFIL